MDRHKSWIMLDNYKRIFFLKTEIKRFLLKNILKNKKISFSRRFLISYYILNLPRVSTRTLIRNRCSLTGRVWGLNKQTKLTRFVFRNKMNKSDLPGFNRASW